MAAAEIGSFPPGVKRFFLLGAPIIALIIYWILPNTYTDIHNQVLPFNPHAKACLAVVVWMVLWWLFEPVPIPVTSLLPIPLFPLLGIAKSAQARRRTHQVRFSCSWRFILGDCRSACWRL